MSDLRRKIPGASFLNGVIIAKLDSLPQVREACSDVMRTAGSPEINWPLANIAHTAGMMYCLLVVPRELFDSPGDSSLFDELKADCLSERFTVTIRDPAFDRDPEGQLLRRLRNSVSHANFSVSVNEFEFWDGRPGAASPEWRATIEWDDLLWVLSKLGHHFGEAGR